MGKDSLKPTVITFREGCSGNWFAELLTITNSTPPVRYRQDEIYPGVILTPDSVFHYDGNSDSDNDLAIHQYQGQPFITCHSTNYSLLQEYWDPRKIYRISPRTGIFDAIAAAYYKLGPGWSETSVDQAHEYIKRYYALHTRIDPLPDNVIDYGMLKNEQLLSQLLENEFNLAWTSHHSEFTQEYWKLQILLDADKTVDNLLTTTPTVFNRACFVFVYELINRLPETARKWSIESVPETWAELQNLMKYC